MAQRGGAAKENQKASPRWGRLRGVEPPRGELISRLSKLAFSLSLNWTSGVRSSNVWASPKGTNVISRRCNLREGKPENQVPTPKGSNIRPLRGRKNSFLAVPIRRFHLRLMILFPFGEQR